MKGKKELKRKTEARTRHIQSLLEPSLYDAFIQYLQSLPPEERRYPSDFIRAKIIRLLEENNAIPKGKY